MKGDHTGFIPTSLEKNGVPEPGGGVGVISALEQGTAVTLLTLGGPEGRKELITIPVLQWEEKGPQWLSELREDEKKNRELVCL